MKVNKQGLAYNPGRVTRLTGQRFSHLKVLGRSGNSGKFAAWLCQCDCGTERVFGGDQLRKGKARICGINGHTWLAAHPNPPGITTEFKSEHQSWTNMRARCADPKHKKYPAYGGRGITVCERWADFKNFMLDMGRKPEPKFTIEREDVNGNYEPKNCKWISRKDQGRNKRNSVFVTYEGRRILLLDLVEELGLSRNIVYQRLKLGWTLAQAIALPLCLGINRGRPRGSYKKTKGQ